MLMGENKETFPHREVLDQVFPVIIKDSYRSAQKRNLLAQITTVDASTDDG